MRLRVMTWNVHHGVGRTGLDLQRIAAVIAAATPDIVGLQELDCRWGARSADADQPAELGQRLGMHVSFAGNVSRPGAAGGASRRYGIALLAPTPIADVEHRLYPQVGRRREPRGYLLGSLPEFGVKVCCTHLTARATLPAGLVRRRQVQTLLTDLRARTPPIPLVFGDFNATALTPPPRMMRRQYQDAFRSAGRGRGGTQVGSLINRRLDYVWVDRGWSVEAAEIVETDASDHKPVVVDCQWP